MNRRDSHLTELGNRVTVARMKLKMQRRLAWAAKHMPKRQTPCPNCGELGAHFVPPSMGEEGFFTCERREAPASPLTQPTP